MTRPLFRVTCEPWEHGLVLHIDGVGVTQTHQDYPDTVEDMARSYIALTFDVEPDSFDIAVTGPETTAAIHDALARVERGEPTRDLGDFAQYLDAEPFADTDLDGPEARETILGADDYQRLLDTLDDADRAHGQAMRARKRGGTGT